MKVLNMMLGIQTAVRSVFSIGTHEMVSTDFKFSYFFEIVPRFILITFIKLCDLKN